VFPNGNTDPTALVQLIISQGDRVPLEHAISEWLDAKLLRSGSTRTVQNYRNTMDAFRQMLRRANLDLDSDMRAVTRAAEAWAYHGADGVSPVSGQTTNLRLAAVSSFYIFCTKRSLLVDANGVALPNPVSQIERARVQPYTSTPLLSAERVIERLAEIDRSTLLGKRDYAMLAVALQTGRLASELRMLSFGDLEVDHSRMTVTWRRVKGGKVMYDVLADGTRDALLDWLYSFYGEKPSKDAPVFASARVAIAVGGLRTTGFAKPMSAALAHGNPLRRAARSHMKWRLWAQV
jgi:site-specific recombinase XerD